MSQTSTPPGTYTWHFPLPRTHTGMLLGNGLLGAMVWGEGGRLCVTLGRADYWDRRGGSEWREDMSYANIKAHLARNDEDGLKKIFADNYNVAGGTRRPSVLPVGRFELDFGKATLETGQLSLKDGLCTVTLKQGRRAFRLQLVLDMADPVLAVRLPPGLKLRQLRRVTAWDHLGEHLAQRGFAPPRRFTRGGICGWTQDAPADPSLCVLAEQRPGELVIGVTTAPDTAAAEAKARGVCATGSFSRIAGASREWWRRYWGKIGRISVPNERLQFLHDYGMFKFAGLTASTPDRAVAATLQGPWIEEYQMPPWSSDYHFNINVQMCYWPAWHGNAIAHLKPLFAMVDAWTPILRRNAKLFVGVDDGRLLPHAVSDECKFICGYWGHSVDHGCTAWVAQMMYRYYRYSNDLDFLRRTAYPFMAGTMAVYEAMLEPTPDGSFRLAVGISPEYFSKKGQGWGPNASFQLACIHRLAEDLVDAAAALGVNPKPIWREYLQKLPKACIGKEGDQEMIMLWEGLALEESHRHHSHLGGIVPFDLFDPDREDERWRNILGKSIDYWVYMGMGLWSGWCMSWAAAIYTRFNRGESAEMLIEMWQHAFTNQGDSTLHDADIPGLTVFGQTLRRPQPLGDVLWRNEGGRHEVMQMDAAMGVTAAIQEMLLHTRRGVNYVMAGTPADWRDVEFRDFLTDRGMVVSARREAGRLARIQVSSSHGGDFKLANPWAGPARVRKNGKPLGAKRGDVLTISTRPGDRLEIAPAP